MSRTDLQRPLRTPRRCLRSVLAPLMLIALLAAACQVTDADVALQAEPAAGQTAEGAVEAATPNTVAPDTTPPSGSSGPAPSAPPLSSAPAPRSSDIECAIPEGNTSLTAPGRQMLTRHRDEVNTIPAYQLVVDVHPTSGRVAGALRATVPAQERVIHFRVFAGMDAFDADLVIENVTVSGEPVEVQLDRALLTVPAAPIDGIQTVVELEFSYTIDQMAANENLLGALTGDSLQPDQVGLLGRTPTGMQMGHWFPVWLPDGTRTDPDPSGFGDIGAFPAADICATIRVPAGYEVVTSGTRFATSATSITEGGAGLRDFSMLISDDLQLAAGVAYGVEIRVWGPADDPASLIAVLDIAVASHTALTDAFGPYPWKEVDIIAAPLGAGVGGMEWPGAIWIEQNLFAGGLPGLGDLGGLIDDDMLGELLGSAGGPALTTSLEWTVAHELGHEWWHATVGNDSIESPAVDEPLAQFAACIAMQSIHPDRWRDICEAQTIEQYAQARALGIADAVAEQPSDAFDSSLQYGAIVYGKAPGFYLAAADLIGWDSLTDALRSFVTRYSFDLVSTDTLRSHLIEWAAGEGDQIAALWDRWFRDVKGDEDIEPSELLADLGGANLDDLLDGLDSTNLEDLNLDELLDGLDGTNLNDLSLEDVLQELLEAGGN